MKERRTLIEGLKPKNDMDRAKEEAFINEGKNTQPKEISPVKPSVPKEAREGKGPAASVRRTAVTIRFRTDIAKALKRASLQRELNGIDPFHVQDILELCVEPWLRENGYLR